MATTEYAIKRLTKFGAVEHNHLGQYWLEHKGEVISFFDQKGEAICIRVRSKNDHDDAMTDYSAGVFVDNISQAIRIARW